MVGGEIETFRVLGQTQTLRVGVKLKTSKFWARLKHECWGEIQKLPSSGPDSNMNVGGETQKLHLEGGTQTQQPRVWGQSPSVAKAPLQTQRPNSHSDTGVSLDTAKKKGALENQEVSALLEDCRGAFLMFQFWNHVQHCRSWGENTKHSAG